MSKICIFLLLVCISAGCFHEYERKVIMPINLKEIRNKQSKDKPFKFIFYSGDNSCNKCFLNMIIWKGLIEESEFELENKIEFIFIFSSKKKDNIENLLIDYEVENKAYLDLVNEFGKLNNFDNSLIDFKGYFVDKDYNILIEGDPSRDREIWNEIKKLL